MEEEYLKDKIRNDNYDIWYESWQKKEFPKGMEVVWKEWREFWDDWYTHPDLTIQEAFTVYQMNKEKNA